MEKIAVLLRTLHLYGHNTHHLIKGSFADHTTVGEFYTQAATDYDQVVERIIGTTGQIDLISVHDKVNNILKKLPHNGDASKSLEFILELEKKLCKEVESAVKGKLSEGSKQLIGDVANRSESRQYLIKQRIAS